MGAFIEALDNNKLIECEHSGKEALEKKKKKAF